MVRHAHHEREKFIQIIAGSIVIREKKPPEGSEINPSPLIRDGRNTGFGFDRVSKPNDDVAVD